MQVHGSGDNLTGSCPILRIRTVALGVLSKTYGLAGLRIGWLASLRATVLVRVAEMKHYTHICSSAPSEFLAELALRRRAQLAARSLQIILANLLLLDEFFRHHLETFEWICPSAGPIAFPRLSYLGCRPLLSRPGDPLRRAAAPRLGPRLPRELLPGRLRPPQPAPRSRAARRAFGSELKFGLRYERGSKHLAISF